MSALIPKTNATVGSVTPPTAGVLQTGEVAENKYTGRLYMKREDGTVVDAGLTRLMGDVVGLTTTPTSNLDQGLVSCQIAAFRGVPLTTVAPALFQTPTYTSNGLFEYKTPTISGFEVSSVAATTGQILEFQLNTDGVQRWTPTTIPLAKAIAGFKGNFIDTTSVACTYARAGNTITVTSVGHGFSVGHGLYFNTSSGSVTDKTLVVATVIDSDHFTCTDTASGTTSGNATYRLCPLSNAVNIDSIAYLGSASDAAAYCVNMKTGIGWTYRHPSPSTLNSAGSSNDAMVVFLDAPTTFTPTQMAWVFRTYVPDNVVYKDCGEYSSVLVM